MQTATATQPTTQQLRNAVFFARNDARRASGTVAERTVEDIKVCVVHLDDGKFGKDVFILVNKNNEADFRVVVNDFDSAVNVLASAFLWQ